LRKSSPQARCKAAVAGAAITSCQAFQDAFKAPGRWRIVHEENAVAIVGNEGFAKPQFAITVAGSRKDLSHFSAESAVGELSDPQSLRVYVSQLRQTIESAPERPQLAQGRASPALLNAIYLMTCSP
jgi:hypothetical protein